MTELKIFTFNPFRENTFILFDETAEAVVIDPGCYSQDENNSLLDFIQSKKLILKEILYTHCHLDHIAGAAFLHKTFPDACFTAHAGERIVLEAADAQARMFGVPLEAPPPITRTVTDGSSLTFGNTTLKALLVPGHSPGSLCFVHHQQRFVIAGDVLFNGSIGRGDLPGGDPVALVRNIKNSLLPLPDDYCVYPGHGPSTTIGREKAVNPFLVS